MRRHDAIVLLCLLAACVLLVLGYVFIGLDAENWDYNFPRRVKIVLAIIVVGAAIGLSAVTFQTVTANQILTPSIIGLDSLYLFIQTLVVYTLGSGKLAMMNDLPSFILTVLLMAGFSAILFSLMFRKEASNVYFLVLVGFICGTVFSGLASFMQIIIDPSEFSVLEGRMFATFNRINVSLMGAAAVVVFAMYLLTVWDYPVLDVLTLGRSQAINLGVDYRKAVLRTLVATALMTSAATVLVGPITFLGIMAVSLARQLVRTFRHAVLVHASMMVTTAILLLGMLVTERLFVFSAPLSVILNFVGGGYFLMLLVRMRRT